MLNVFKGRKILRTKEINIYLVLVYIPMGVDQISVFYPKLRSFYKIFLGFLVVYLFNKEWEEMCLTHP